MRIKTWAMTLRGHTMKSAVGTSGNPLWPAVFRVQVHAHTDGPPGAPPRPLLLTLTADDARALAKVLVDAADKPIGARAEFEAAIEREAAL